MGTDGNATAAAKARSERKTGAWPQRAKDLFDLAQKAGGDVLQSVETVFHTVTGKAVLEKVAAYVQESEAVNTAMATRIYDLLAREEVLRVGIAATEKTSRRHRRWLLASVIAHAATISAIVYLLLSRP
jgi:hypothetical protein